MQDLILNCVELPRSGETVLGRMAVGQGGKGSNQAIASNRAGARTAFVGAVGADSYAGQIRKFYRQERIGGRLATKRHRATGLAVVVLNHAGQNQIIIEPGANAALEPADVPSALLKHARIVVVQLEANPKATEHALRTARRFGVTTLLNPAPMRADFDLRLLRYVDILVPNETEFAALARRLPDAPANGSPLARCMRSAAASACRP
jgi:ribokinase